MWTSQLFLTTKPSPLSLYLVPRPKMETHKGAVARLAEEVARFYSSRTPFWIYHGSKNCTRQVSFDRSGIVDTSNLNHVLEINSKSMVVIAEPNVPMYLLVQTTLKHGLIPPVVPEFPGITVGAAPFLAQLVKAVPSNTAISTGL